ncbi:hypothetical protein ACFXTI_022688 [Malus domestica]
MESGRAKLLCATEKGSGRANILLFAFLYDITTLLLDTKAFKNTIDLFVERYKDKEISVVAGVEARGFIFGPPIALAIGAKFVPLRKPKKLPDVKAVMKNSGTVMIGVGPSVNITFGAIVDDRYNGELHVTIIVTGFSQSFQKTLLINRPQGSKAA